MACVAHRIVRRVVYRVPQSWLIGRLEAGRLGVVCWIVGRERGECMWRVWDAFYEWRCFCYEGLLRRRVFAV